jgi:uncharacterized protein YndB with AHSA1/START domain
VYVIYIVTTSEKLWQALTKSQFMEHYWFGGQMTSDWQAGSTVELLMHDGRLGMTGRISESDPPRRLSYSWHVEFHEPFAREQASRVAFELEPLGTVVRLTLIHDGFPPESNVFNGIREGWPKILSSLKSLQESGRPLSVSSAADYLGRTEELVGNRARFTGIPARDNDFVM